MECSWCLIIVTLFSRSKTNCEVAIITERKLKSSSVNYLDFIYLDYCSTYMITRIEKSTNDLLTDLCRLLGKVEKYNR